MDLLSHSKGPLYPNLKLPLWLSSQDAFAAELGFGERFRIVLIEDGSGILRLGERRFAFMAPTLFCLNENEMPQLEQGTALRTRVCFFHPRIINQILNFDNIRDRKTLTGTDRNDSSWLRAFTNRDAKYSGYLAIGINENRRASHLMMRIAEEVEGQTDKYWPCRTRSYFIELLILIDRIYVDPRTINGTWLTETPDEMDEIISFLLANHHRKIMISELTRTFNMNRTTLMKRFNEATGTTIIAYLTHIRMQMAAMILRDTTLPITEIIDRVGYSDPSHFGRAFRVHLGLAPSEYREKYCWM